MRKGVIFITVRKVLGSQSYASSTKLSGGSDFLLEQLENYPRLCLLAFGSQHLKAAVLSMHPSQQSQSQITKGALRK